VYPSEILLLAKEPDIVRQCTPEDLDEDPTFYEPTDECRPVIDLGWRCGDRRGGVGANFSASATREASDGLRPLPRCVTWCGAGTTRATRTVQNIDGTSRKANEVQCHRN
jgi:hypothetical protein